jgi:hypothetical protein
MDETREKLGEVTAPSGTALLLDAGLLGFLGQFELPSIRCTDLPTGRPMAVTGVRMGEGDDAECWRHVDLEVELGAKLAQREALGTALVDFAQLMFVDSGALSGWEHTESLDGKADFVFWGQDGAKLAAEVEAPVLVREEGLFGWLDLPVDEAMERGHKAELLVEARSLELDTDLRPHSHHHQMLEQIRTKPTASGTLELGRAKLCAFHTTWGQGVFPVERHIDNRGRVMRVRILLSVR